MSRWIKVESVIADLDHGLWGKDWDKVLAEAIIREAPAINLVRCKECKHCKRASGTFKGEPIIYYRCHENNRDVESDDYCSWGERSE